MNTYQRRRWGKAHIVRTPKTVGGEHSSDTQKLTPNVAKLNDKSTAPIAMLGGVRFFKSSFDNAAQNVLSRPLLSALSDARETLVSTTRA